MRRTSVTGILLLLIISGIILLSAPFTGSTMISLRSLLAHDTQSHILFFLRIPRVVMAFCAGAGLAVCGMLFQALFRNPLADPFTLGIASGASCGAAATILAGFTGAILGVPVLSIGAFSGSALSIILVYGLVSLKRSSSSIIMLLAGIAVSFFFSSVLMLFQYLSTLRDSFQILRWLMGGVEVYGYQQILSMLPFFLVGMTIIFFFLPELDQILAGEDIARSRGVNIKRIKYWSLAGATLVVGSIVSVCGPIGFIGLLAPHMCRSLFSSRHLVLAPVSMLFGGCFLVLCDTIARTIIAPAEMPVGVITALIGGPFFLWILFRKHPVSLFAE